MRTASQWHAGIIHPRLHDDHVPTQQLWIEVIATKTRCCSSLSKVELLIHSHRRRMGSYPQKQCCQLCRSGHLLHIPFLQVWWHQHPCSHLMNIHSHWSCSYNNRIITYSFFSRALLSKGNTADMPIWVHIVHIVQPSTFDQTRGCCLHYYLRRGGGRESSSPPIHNLSQRWWWFAAHSLSGLVGIWGENLIVIMIPS